MQELCPDVVVWSAIKTTEPGKQGWHQGTTLINKTETNTSSNTLLNLYTLATWGWAVTYVLF